MERGTGIAVSGEYVEIEDGNVLNTLLLPAQKDMLRANSQLPSPPPLLKVQSKKQSPRPIQTVSSCNNDSCLILLVF